MTPRLISRLLIAVVAIAAALWPAAASANTVDLDQPIILVAKRDLRDRLYGHTVLLARPLGNERHVGVIVNKPTQMTLGKLFPSHPASRKIVDPVFLGGPVGSEVIFALVQRKDSPGSRSLRIAPDLFLATDSRVVDKIIESEPAQARFFAGVVLWAQNELAEEVKRGLWFTQAPTSEVVLRKQTDGMWEEMVGRLERKANTI
ncbi:MAG: YqgE/AlgH family protein [Betaproteobacteria bacterium]